MVIRDGLIEIVDFESRSWDMTFRVIVCQHAHIYSLHPDIYDEYFITVCTFRFSFIRGVYFSIYRPYDGREVLTRGCSLIFRFKYVWTLSVVWRESDFWDAGNLRALFLRLWECYALILYV